MLYTLPPQTHTWDRRENYMDKIDLGILRCLKENSRQTASTISQTINLSVSAVIERIRKMEQKGIIQIGRAHV